MIGISVLGSTGSIGISTLDVIAQHPERYRAVGLAANTDVEGLFQQCERFQPTVVAMADEASAAELAKRLASIGSSIEVLAGEAGVIAIAELTDAEMVMAAIVGAAGLTPTLAAVRKGKRILLANKESLVVAGDLFMREAKAHKASVLPIDSEHNAVFQCMPQDFEQGLAAKGVKRILLTASGGPFRTWTNDQLKSATPEQACAHPNWSMGRKISVDSATMMNKGLEVIEARWLFDATPTQIKVVVHPQSVVHSMVQYVDGSVLAQLGNPDMRTPIAHAMAWPERHGSGVASLDLFEVARLDFEEPDTQRFPCLRLAFDAVAAAGVAPAVLNAANEVAVDAFLSKQLAFVRIPEIIETVLSQNLEGDLDSVEGLMAIDQAARAATEQLIH
ncbi:MAG: 1-deoxy-D-xylulose-5-phosphate reductoisomerase [Sedimenticolaceae bacterium]